MSDAGRLFRGKKLCRRIWANFNQSELRACWRGQARNDGVSTPQRCVFDHAAMLARGLQVGCIPPKACFLFDALAAHPANNQEH
jgi:hypothetical protein